jgi:hypothetical protein
MKPQGEIFIQKTIFQQARGGVKKCPCVNNIALGVNTDVRTVEKCAEILTT